MNLNEFGDWGLNKGQVANPNGTYAGQCVSLVQQYLNQVFGIPYKSRGNAKDWATNNELLNYFDRIGSNNALQRGDVLVYGANYGGGYGHIGLIDINMKWYDQNGVKSLHVGYKDTPFTGYVCILRPKNQDALGLPSSNFNVRVDKAEANVRTAPSINAPLGGSQVLHQGDTFVSVGTVTGDNVNGNNIWYKSTKGNYLHSNGLTKI